MRLLTLADILPLEEYERRRARIRRTMIALKERRRVPLGPHLTFLFENRETVWYQIQEMVRIERMFQRQQIAHEIRTYRSLLPRQGELSATLLIEFDDPEIREGWLRRLLGLERSLFLRVGDLPPVAAVFDPDQIGVDRLSAVQFLRFVLPGSHRRAWRRAAREGAVRIESTHSEYTECAALSPAALRELSKDLERSPVGPEPSRHARRAPLPIQTTPRRPPRRRIRSRRIP